MKNYLSLFTRWEKRLKQLLILSSPILSILLVLFLVPGISYASCGPDTTPPIAVCNDITVALDMNGMSAISPMDIDGGSTDNCSIQSLVLSTTAFGCDDISSPNNYALQLDGVQKYVDIPTSTDWESPNHTVELWVRPQFALSGTNDILVANRLDGISTRWSYHMAGDLSSIMLWNNSILSIWPFTFVQNQWYHIAFVQNGSFTEAFVNGVSLGTHPHVQGTATGLPLRIGSNGSGEFNQSTFDEVRIWSTARTAAEINAGMNNTLTGNEPNLLAYYDFENGTLGTTAIDRTNNNHDGALVAVVPASDFVPGAPAVLSNSGSNAVVLTVTDTSGNVDSCTANVLVRDTTPIVTACKDITIQLDANGMASFSPADADNGSNGVCNFTLSLTDTLLDCSHLSSPNSFALALDGVDEFIEVPPNPAWESANHTLELWVNPLYASSPTNDILVSNRGVNTRWSYHMDANRNSIMMWNNSVLTVWPFSFNQNQWYHIAFVMTASNTTAYVNGVSLGAQSNVQGTTTGLPFRIGSSGSGEFINASIDEVRFWNYARSATEIQADMNTTLIGNETGLVAYYDFENGPGYSILSDRTTNNHNGTLINMEPALDWVAGAPGVNRDPVDRTLTVVDAFGASSFCTFQVTVDDTIHPLFDCLTDTIIASGPNFCGTIFNYTIPVINDNCQGFSLSQLSGLGSGSFFPKGTTTETVVITDGFGNNDTCSFNITVNDSTLPLIGSDTADFHQILKATASDGQASDFFGWNVDMDGNWAAVGARLVDDTFVNVGAVYMYEFDGNTWIERQKLLPSSQNNGSAFGNSVAISANKVIVGAEGSNGNSTNSGAAYVFAYNGSTWIEEQKIVASDGQTSDFFGHSVSISGNWVIVGARQQDAVDTNAGAAYLYEFNGSSWIEQQKITASDGEKFDEFGQSVSIQGNIALIGAPEEDANGSNAGAVYYFEYNGTSWVEQQKIFSSDGNVGHRLGTALAISGNKAIAGALFGDGNQILSGAAYVYELSGGTWTEEAKLTASDGQSGDNFGLNVDISGSLAISGTPFSDRTGPDAGDAYIFKFNNGSWQEQKLPGTHGSLAELFGQGVAVSGNKVVVSAYRDNLLATDAGSVYFFEDTTGPMNDCVQIPDTIFLSAGKCDTILSLVDAVFSDNCPGPYTIQYDFDGDNVVDFTGSNPTQFYPRGASASRFIVTDASGNTSECTFNVLVLDNSPPAISCPADITDTIGLGSCDTAVIYITPVGTDDCPGPVTTQLAGLPSGSFFPIGTTTNIFEVTDSSGQKAQCSFDVTVNGVDAVPPTITCPADFTVGNDSGSCGAVVNYSPVTADNCPGETVSVSVGLASGTLFPIGVTNNTLVVSDVVGNLDSCSFSVTVQDTSVPVAACSDITIYLDNAGNGSFSLPDIDNGSFDNCPGMSIALGNEIPAGVVNCNLTGINSVSLTATDTSGNSDTCLANVTVLDTIAPQALCLDDTLFLDTTGNALLSVNNIDNGSSDACGIQSFTLSKSSFNCADVGANTVMLTVTDSSGNTNNCTATVYIEDTVAPTALCMDVTVYLDTGGNASLKFSDVDNGTFDACGINSTSLSISSFSCADTGVTPNMLVVNDGQGNSANCSFNVTVADSSVPNAICRDLTIYLDNAGNGSFTLNDIDNGSNDNCPGLVLALGNELPGGLVSCTDIGLNTVSLFATDLSGNSDTCSANVTVADTTRPTALCLNDTVFLDLTGNVFINVNDIDNGSSDACGIQSIALYKSSFNCADIGINTVSLTVTDSSGNNDSCQADITVVDTVAPNAVCQDITVFLDSTGNTTFTVNDINNGSTDACGIDSLSIDVTSLTCTDTGVTVITLGAMNSSIFGQHWDYCTANVTVDDSIAPVILSIDSILSKVYTPSSSVGAQFGLGVAMDGIHAAIGENFLLPLRWGVHMYQKSATGWTYTETIHSPSSINDGFGSTVAIQGNRMVIGALAADSFGNASGLAYVYEYNGSNWIYTQVLHPSNHMIGVQFGTTVDMDGDVIIVGAPLDNSIANQAGAAHVFRYNGSYWVEEAKLVAPDGGASDWAGRYLGVSGNTVVIAAVNHDLPFLNSGAAYVFEYSGSSWNLVQKLGITDSLMHSSIGLDIDIEGDFILMGRVNDSNINGLVAGAVYVYERSGGVWPRLETQKLISSQGTLAGFFGEAIHMDVNIAMIGASNELSNSGSIDGAAYIFENNGGTWQEINRISPADSTERFGMKLALSGNDFIVGVAQDNFIGAAYFSDSDIDSCFTLPDTIVLPNNTCDTLISVIDLPLVSDNCPGTHTFSWDLDGDNIADTTSTGISNRYSIGNHQITLFVTDEFGNTSSCAKQFFVDYSDRISFVGGPQFCNQDIVTFLLEDADSTNVFLTINGNVPVGNLLITDSMQLPVSAVAPLLYLPNNMLVFTHTFPSNPSCTYDDTLFIEILSDSICACDYVLSGPASVNCSPDTFTVWFNAAIPVTIGLRAIDACLTYDAQVVRPTGTSQLGSVITTSSTDAAVTIIENSPGQLNISAHYTGSAPSTASFDGVGQVFGIDFVANGFAGSKTFIEFTSCYLQESYTLFTREKCANSTSSAITFSGSTLFDGRITYRDDLSRPLKYDTLVPATYNETNINFSNCLSEYDSTGFAGNPDTLGHFPLSTLSGNFMINRDIRGDFHTIDPFSGLCTNVMAEINGFDAYLVSLVSTFSTIDLSTNTSFVPSPLQMIAADVNMDDKVTSSDVFHILQRSVNAQCEYPQTWNYTETHFLPPRPPLGGFHSKDWRFVDEATYFSNDDYRIQPGYPTINPANVSGNGYWKNDVPDVPNCYNPGALGDDCIDFMDFYGVMLGDVDGNWSLASAGSRSNNGLITIDLSAAIAFGDTLLKVPVYAAHDKPMVSVDMDVSFNTDLPIVDVNKTAYATSIGLNENWNNVLVKELMISSYSLQNIANNNALLWIDIHPEDADKLIYEVKQSVGYINGKACPVFIKDGTATNVPVVNDINGQILVFPNPTKDKVNIEFIGNHGKSTVKLYDINGKLLQAISVDEQTHVTEFDLSAYANATYLVHITSATGNRVVKVIKE